LKPIFVAMSQVTTLSIFKYKSLADKVWAFGMMQFAHSHLKKAKGCQFYKLLGSGKENFNPFPDWSIYALLQVWDHEKQASDFIEHSKLFKKYFSHANQHQILYMNNIQAKGEWSGKNPFQSVVSSKAVEGKLAVITRASIKLNKLRTFWKFVPTSQKPLLKAKGLNYTKGFGEVPFTEMATFSIWNSTEELYDFAYRSKEHVEAIQKTRKIDWYSEELFSRFEIYKSQGDLLNL
jgi:spheroidene monooxygenase